MDATLLTILTLFAIGTGIGVLQARRRDKCLRHFDGYRITLAEADGDLVWGDLTVEATGLEVRYVAPVHARRGHLEQSFLIYRDQYPTIDALYRYPLALSPEQQERRARVIRQTVRPSLGRRIGRVLRNWLGMVRDAVVQAVSVIVGVAKTRAPGAAVLASQEAGLKALSSEVIGYTGNAFDPLLERHLSERVVVEVTREGRKREYCGWLKDYSSEFIELLDAVVSDREPMPPTPFRPGEEPMPGVAIRAEAQTLTVANRGAPMLFVREVRAGDWQRTMALVVPDGATANLMLPPEVDPFDVEVWIGTVQRVDLVLPRTHALVRHAAVLAEQIAPTSESDAASAPETIARETAEAPASS